MVVSAFVVADSLGLGSFLRCGQIDHSHSLCIGQGGHNRKLQIVEHDTGISVGNAGQVSKCIICYSALDLPQAPGAFQGITRYYQQVLGSQGFKLIDLGTAQQGCVYFK